MGSGLTYKFKKVRIKKMKVELNLKVSKDKKTGKEYKNLVITTEAGTTFEVKYAFYNSKLSYKVMKEIEG